MKAYVQNLCERLWAWLGQVMSENGSASMMRLAMLIWHIAFAGVWTILSLCKREMIHIDGSLLAVLGMTTGAKLAQKPLEAPAPLAPPIDTPPRA